MRGLEQGTLRYGTAALLAAFITFAGPARAVDPALLDAARKEGSVTWYTAQIINQLVRPMADAFEKKYGIKVNAVRADASDNALRIAAEGAAGKMQADVFDGTTTAPSLERLGLVLKWQPDSAKHLPPQFVDRNGYWVANNLYVQNPSSIRASCRAAVSRKHGTTCSIPNGAAVCSYPGRPRHRRAPVSSVSC